MYKDVKNKPTSQMKTDKEQYISEAFATAKDIIYALPIVPRYDLIQQMAQDIERGDFDDISSISEAKNHWGLWLDRAKKMLRSRNIILSRLRLTKK